MIICIIMLSLLVLGSLLLIIRKVCLNNYFRWRNTCEYYRKYLDEYEWANFGYQKLKNPNYDKEKYERAKKKFEFYHNAPDESFIVLGGFAVVIGILGILICSTIALASNFGANSNIEYLNMLETRAIIEREYEENPDNVLIYQDVIEFNNNLRKIKIKYDSPWFNWFQNHKVAENIDYIEVKNVHT